MPRPPRDPRALIPEREILRQAMLTLRWKGWETVRVNSGMIVVRDARGKEHAYRGAAAGTSDLIGTMPGGRSFYLECKRFGAIPTDVQAAFLRRMGAVGAFAAWFDRLDLLDELIAHATAGGSVVVEADKRMRFIP